MVQILPLHAGGVALRLLSLRWIHPADTQVTWQPSKFPHRRAHVPKHVSYVCATVKCLLLT